MNTLQKPNPELNELNITFEHLQQADIDQAATLTAQSFTHDQPIVVHLKLKSSQLKQYVIQLMNTQRLHRSFVARHNNKIIGVALNELYSDKPVYCSAKWQKNMKIYTDELDEQIQHNFLKNFNNPPHQLFLFSLAACQKKYYNKGIYTKLAQMSLAYAKQIGCKYAFVNCFGDKALHIFHKKFNFEILEEHKYSEMSGSLQILNDCKADKLVILQKQLSKSNK